MSKKRTGLLIAASAAIGAVAGISYYLKYKSFNDEIDKDFHDYEEETEEMTKDEPVSCADTKRTYITLDSNKCKSCEDAASCEETAPAECPKAESPKTEEASAEIAEEVVDETPIAATVEEDTEGAN